MRSLGDELDLERSPSSDTISGPGARITTTNPQNKNKPVALRLAATNQNPAFFQNPLPDWNPAELSQHPRRVRPSEVDEAAVTRPRSGRRASLRRGSSENSRAGPISRELRSGEWPRKHHQQSQQKQTRTAYCQRDSRPADGTGYALACRAVWPECPARPSAQKAGLIRQDGRHTRRKRTSHKSVGEPYLGGFELTSLGLCGAHQPCGGADKCPTSATGAVQPGTASAARPKQSWSVLSFD